MQFRIPLILTTALIAITTLGCSGDTGRSNSGSNGISTAVDLQGIVDDLASSDVSRHRRAIDRISHVPSESRHKLGTILLSLVDQLSEVYNDLLNASSLGIPIGGDWEMTIDTTHDRVSLLLSSSSTKYALALLREERALPLFERLADLPRSDSYIYSSYVTAIKQGNEPATPMHLGVR